MQLPPFRLERYFAQYEFNAPYLLCCSDCESVSVADLLALEPGAAEALHGLWLGYGESQGDPSLRRQIAALYTGLGPDQVLVHSGAEEAIFNFMHAVLQPGDHAVVHQPGYQSLYEVAAAIGCAVTPWVGDPAAGWRLDLDELRRALRPNTKLVVLNCPHNPTGYLMEHGDFLELVALSQRHGFLLFSDEVYRGLELDPADRLPALCEMDERGVSLGVMSKSYGLPGLRIGWLATRNADLYAQLAAFKDYTTICNSAPSEFLAALALRHGPRLIERNMGLIRRNLALLDGFFARHTELFVWHAPPAGPIAFPQVVGRDADALCADLVQRSGVLLLPGSAYAPGWNHVRVGYGRANLPECLAALELALHG